MQLPTDDFERLNGAVLGRIREVQVLYAVWHTIPYLVVYLPTVTHPSQTDLPASPTHPCAPLRAVRSLAVSWWLAWCKGCGSGGH